MEINNTVKLNRYVNIAVLVAAAMAGAYYYQGYSAINQAHATPVAAPVAPVAPQATITLPNFASIAANEGAAVVNISVKGMVKTSANVNALPQLDPDDPLSQFFKHFQPNTPDAETPVSGMGSGFIVKSDGVVLTNAHVVADADEVTVKLTDKREFQAKVIGIDKPTDVAVLKIDAKNLPTVKVGSTQNTRVGDWVLAIGAPFGFENTVTAGIVSAKSRALPDEGYVPFLQTDVAINPGNSGGPLFNLNGEVIGINSQIYSRSGGYQGLSFAIPIDVAMKIEQQLVDHGKVSRGRLGVGIQGINQDLANSFGLDKAEGALVSSVDKNGPADKAGIEPGDVITKFNGKSIERASDLPALVAEVAPGQTATVEVWRKKQSKQISVKVDEMKIADAKPVETQANKGKLGLVVRPLTDEEQAQTELKYGVLVQDVVQGPAAKAGIQAGDVILAVNGDPVKSAKDLIAEVDKSKKTLALLVMRGDDKIYVPVHLG
jgi:serine protease Do